MPASNSEARKRHEAGLRYCDRHMPRTDPAAIGLVYDDRATDTDHDAS